MSARAHPSLVEGWARGALPLRDVLGVPAEAVTAAHLLGERCLALGDHDRAETIFAGLAVLDVADARAAAALADLALARGRPELARAWAERALAVRPGEPALVALLARARVALAQPPHETTSVAQPASSLPSKH